jgi:SAM-dependent methyltransferase
MGFFTLELARLVGPGGRVVAVDLQPPMLAGLRRRAGKAGLEDRIDLRLAPAASLGVADLRGTVDFILAFAMVHELPDPAAFFFEAAAALRAGGRMLLAEPRGHVTERAFAATLETASQAGLDAQPGPAVWRSWTALLGRG